MDVLIASGWGEQRCVSFNPVDDTQAAAIDAQHWWVPNKMSMKLATKGLLILSSNYHQNVNCQSVLYIIDCSPRHHWLYASFCWVVDSTHSDPLYVLSLFRGHQLSKWAHTHTHTGKHTGINAPCEMHWKRCCLVQQTHVGTHLSPSRQGPLQSQQSFQQGSTVAACQLNNVSQEDQVHAAK